MSSLLRLGSRLKIIYRSLVYSSRDFPALGHPALSRINHNASFSDSRLVIRLRASRGILAFATLVLSLEFHPGFAHNVCLSTSKTSLLDQYFFS